MRDYSHQHFEMLYSQISHCLGYFSPKLESNLNPTFSNMKKILKYTGFTLLGCISFILLYLLAAWGLSRISVDPEPSQRADITIYLKSNGVHTDIIVPVKTQLKDWSKTILFKNTRSGDSSVNYVAFGWGDKGFYLETPTLADVKISTAFKAAFWLSSAAIHTTFYKQLNDDKKCIQLKIDSVQYSRLIHFIEDSFLLNENGSLIPIGEHVRYGNYDAFYDATGSYSLLHTCNTWTNNALKACGQKACLWTPFDSGIFYQYGK